MKIAIAQTKPSISDWKYNWNEHLKLINLAIENDASFIFFPELSLIGYETQNIQRFSQTNFIPAIKSFEKLSKSTGISIAVGLPSFDFSGAKISMFMISKEETRIYSKMFLHGDEMPFYNAGNTLITIKVNNKVLIPAICYESTVDDHYRLAKESNADIYFVSAAKTHSDLFRLQGHYSQLASTLQIPVLLSNSIGYQDGFIAGGMSSAWSNDGSLAGQLDQNTGVLFYDTETHKAQSIYC